MKRPRRLTQFLASKEGVAVIATLVGLAYLFEGQLLGWMQGSSLSSELQLGADDLEADIRRAREMAHALVPTTRTNHDIIVRASSEIEGLQAEILRARAELDLLRRDLLSRRGELDGAPAADSRAEPREVREKRNHLKRAFADYLSQESAIAARRQLLRSREADLTRAKAAQDAALRNGQALNDTIADCEARVRRLRSKDGGAPGGSRAPIDRQKFGELESLLRDIRTRLLVAERLTSLSGRATTESFDEEFSEEPIEREIDRHFSRSAARGSETTPHGRERRAP